jgi:hypothetical protein
LRVLEEGGIAKQSIKNILKEIVKDTDPLTILAKIKSGIPSQVFHGIYAKNAANTSGPKEVVLSEYLVSGEEQ